MPLKCPRIIYSRNFPPKPYIAITLFGMVIARREWWPLSVETINHESIHCRQQREWLYVPFFVLYIIEWIWGWIRLRDINKAYRNISFEREAYDNGSNLNYLRHRKPFANYRK